EAKLGDPNATKDRELFANTARRHAELSDLVEAGQNWEAAVIDLSDAKEILHESTGADREEMRELVALAETDLADSEDEFRTLLLPKDPNDGKNVIVEIRGAEGGEEANLFARDLFEMFQAYSAQHGWKIEVLSADASSLGGYSDVSMVVRGADAWRRLKHEGGPHRVQRVPATESQGRIHTSSATVTVLPEADEVDVNIDPNDLEIDYFRASGPGGQSVNTTDSAVRITHKPTGTVVSMQDEKSQLQNREKALRVLRARILRKQQDEQAAEMSAARRDQVGGGGRSEKIRTYNFKENRVTDHRIGLTLYKLDKVLGGDLDDVVDALLADERQRQLSADGSV
ncbi:peptide chain release factor 1, partial [Acidimicrobiaceae bacterium AH-315-P05]|nr:peptide chain release factor 1 [Acidimicrobiaceae bacterium AH-315-P05]